MDIVKRRRRRIRRPKTDCRCGSAFDMEIDGDDLVMRCPRCGYRRRHKGYIARVLRAAGVGSEEVGG